MLKIKIQEDLKNNLKERNSLAVSVLRLLLAAILNKEKEKRYKLSKSRQMEETELAKESELTDEEIIEVIFSEVKKRKEAVVEYEKGKREELAKKEKDESEILKKYLPEQLSEEEIKKIVEEAVKSLGAKEPRDMGKVMAEIMPKVKGKADGSLVSKIVKEILLSIK